MRASSVADHERARCLPHTALRADHRHRCSAASRLVGCRISRSRSASSRSPRDTSSSLHPSPEPHRRAIGRRPPIHQRRRDVDLARASVRRSSSLRNRAVSRPSTGPDSPSRCGSLFRSHRRLTSRAIRIGDASVPSISPAIDHSDSPRWTTCDSSPALARPRRSSRRPTATNLWRGRDRRRRGGGCRGHRGRRRRRDVRHPDLLLDDPRLRPALDPPDLALRLVPGTSLALCLACVADAFFADGSARRLKLGRRGGAAASAGSEPEPSTTSGTASPTSGAGTTGSAGCGASIGSSAVSSAAIGSVGWSDEPAGSASGFGTGFEEPTLGFRRPAAAGREPLCPRSHRRPRSRNAAVAPATSRRDAHGNAGLDAQGQERIIPAGALAGGPPDIAALRMEAQPSCSSGRTKCARSEAITGPLSVSDRRAAEPPLATGAVGRGETDQASWPLEDEHV